MSSPTDDAAPERPPAPLSERALRLTLLAHAAALVGGTGHAALYETGATLPGPLGWLGSPAMLRPAAWLVGCSAVPIAGAAALLAMRIRRGPLAAAGATATIAAVGLWAGALGAYCGLTHPLYRPVHLTVAFAVFVLGPLLGIGAATCLGPRPWRAGVVTLLVLEATALVVVGWLVVHGAIHGKMWTDIIGLGPVVGAAIGMGAALASLVRGAIVWRRRSATRETGASATAPPSRGSPSPSP